MAIADEAPLGEEVGLLAGIGDEGGLQGQPKLLHQPAVGGLVGAGELAAELHQAAVGEGRLEDPAAGAIARLEDDDVGSRRRQVAGGR